MAPDLQVSAENAIVRDTVLRRVRSVLAGGKGEQLDVRFAEFDQVSYEILSEKKVPLKVTLSMTMPGGTKTLPPGKSEQSDRDRTLAKRSESGV